jgi:chemotaxis protein methyltransferase CheR
MADMREIPESIRADPALAFLYQWIEENWGIRTAPENLNRLKRYLADRYGTPYRREAYEAILENREELGKIAPLITVNETYFFREGVHFRLLSRYVLPRLLRPGRPLRICSAATSSGCEAYSIAMVTDFFCRTGNLRRGEDLSGLWSVDAFDVNPGMIDIANRGLYGPAAMREDGSEWKFLTDLYLRRVDQGFEAAELLRAKLRFFTRNIMEGLPGAYDIIFFRNALIYFSPEGRRKVLALLRNALTETGILVVGVSETAAVEESGLEMVHRMGAFYFARQGVPAAIPAGEPGPGGEPEAPQPGMTDRPVAARPAVADRPVVVAARPGVPEPAAVPAKPAAPKVSPVLPAQGAPRTAARREPAAVQDPAWVARIARVLEREEGRPNAERVLGTLREKGESGEGPLSSAGPAEPDSGELAAAAITLLNSADLPSAALVLSCLEERGSSPVTSFLRGELYYHGGGGAASEAEAKYQEAAAGERGFWPAFYRISSLAEKGNRTRYVYRLKKALESMERGTGRGYEIFIGGFSPDYYRRILEKKLAE